MKERGNFKLGDLTIPIILIVVALLSVLFLGPIISKSLDPFFIRILPLYLVFIILVVFNWYMAAGSGQQISIMMRRNFNMLNTLVPVLSAIEFITLYADYKEEIEEKRIDIQTWLPMALTEIAYTIFTGLLIYNIIVEGLYYETFEVDLAFNRWIISMIFYNTARLLIISRITYGLSTKTYIRGTKIPYIINLVGLALTTLLFIIGRIIKPVAVALSLPIVNIVVFILLPIAVPIYINWKCKSVIKDIKISQTPEESLR